MEYYLNIMKFYHSQQCGWTQKGLCLVKCQKKKDKYAMLSLMYGIEKNESTNEYKPTATDSQISDYQWGKGGVGAK